MIVIGPITLSRVQRHHRIIWKWFGVTAVQGRMLNIFSCHRRMIAFAQFWLNLLVDNTIDLSKLPDSLCFTVPPLSR